MLNKRGLSTVIATLLLIIITIAIAIVVWIIIRNLVSTGSQGVSLGGLTLNLKIKGAQLNSNNISVTVQRQQGAGNLTGINFVLYDGNLYESIQQNANLGIYEGKQFILVPSKVNINSMKTVSVAPIYFSNGINQTGSITDTYNFNAGSSGSGGNDNQNNNSGNNNQSNNSGNGGNNGNNQGDCIVDSSCTSQCSGTGYSNDGGATCYSESTCSAECSSGGGNQNNNNTCVPTTCSLANYQCGNPPNGCGGVLSCGLCNSTSFCTNVYSCQAYQVVNSGTISSSWPTAAPIFFDSANLPTDPNVIISYNDGLHYIKFPGSAQSGCFQLTLLNEESSPSTMSYIEMGSSANVKAGDSYQIWNGQQGCLNS